MANRSYTDGIRARAAASRDMMTRLSESGQAIGAADGYVLFSPDEALAVAALIDAATTIEDCLDSFTPEAPTSAMWKAHKAAVDELRGKLR